MDPTLNPFAPGAGLRPPALVGRDAEITEADTLVKRVSMGLACRGLILYGLRGVGKTVLLNELAFRLDKAQWFVVSVEAKKSERGAVQLRRRLADELQRRARSRTEAFGDAAGAIAAALGSLTLRFGGTEISVNRERNSSTTELDLRDAVLRIAAALQRRQRGFAICVDEIQDIDDELAEDLIEAQHTAGQQGLPFFLLGAGLPGTPARLAGSHSYAERLFNYREVGPLNTAGVDAALNEPAARQNASFSFEAVQAIADASAGYPYFVQEFGQAAWNLADGPQITEEEAHAAVQRGFDALDSAFFASRWSKATDRERDYLGAMAVNDGAPARTREVAERLGTTVQSLSPQRQSLIDKGIIWSPERGKIAFTVPGMAEFIDRLSS